MPHRIGGPEKALCTDITVADPRISVRTTMLSLHTIERFSGFQLQDEHNASYFTKMSRININQSKSKINHFFSHTG